MDFRSGVGRALGVALIGAPLWIGCNAEDETGTTEEPNVGPGVGAPEKPPPKPAKTTGGVPKAPTGKPSESSKP